MPELRHVVLDGLIYQRQASGGITNLFNAILPRMCDLDPEMQVTMFYTTRLLQALPAHTRIQHVHVPALDQYIRPRRYLYPIGNTVRMQLARQYVRKYLDGIWHSTYFTYIRSWRGPKVVTVHDMNYERFPDLFRQPYDEYFRAQKKKCILDADVVICDSESTREDVERYLPVDPTKLQVIYLACNPTFYRLEAPDLEPLLSNSQSYILFVGRRYHYKNFTTLIRAFSKWKYRDQVKLVVAGDATWKLEELGLIAELGITNQVELKISPTDEQLCLLYNGASALVFPSMYEGFGIPLLEAMNSGCPIVASRIPSTLEIAGEVPIYFNPDDSDELTQAMDMALEDGRQSTRVSHGFVQAGRFSWEVTAQKTLEVYRSLQ